MTEKKRALSRREYLQFASVLGIGYGASLVLRSTAPIGRDVSTNAKAQALLVSPGGPVEGPAGANLRVVVFTDYQCPACRKAAPDLEAAFREDARVHLAYKDWPIFGPLSEQAARLALAADFQGLYPPVHHALMRERRPLERSVVQRTIERVGGRWDQIERDAVSHADTIESALARNKQDAFALGIAGTPAFLVGPLLVTGALTRGEFRRVFEQARDLASS